MRNALMLALTVTIAVASLDANACHGRRGGRVSYGGGCSYGTPYVQAPLSTYGGCYTGGCTTSYMGGYPYYGGLRPGMIMPDGGVITSVGAPIGAPVYGSISPASTVSSPATNFNRPSFSTPNPAAPRNSFDTPQPPAPAAPTYPARPRTSFETPGPN